MESLCLAARNVLDQLLRFRVCFLFFPRHDVYSSVSLEAGSSRRVRVNQFGHLAPPLLIACFHVL